MRQEEDSIAARTAILIAAMFRRGRCPRQSTPLDVSANLWKLLIFPRLFLRACSVTTKTKALDSIPGDGAEYYPMAVENLPTLPEKANAIDAMKYMRRITKAIGAGFHPDSEGADYIDRNTGEALFTPEQAERLDKDIERAFELLTAAGRDPYESAARVQRRLLGMPRFEMD
jgi:hypothetical protein